MGILQLRNRLDFPALHEYIIMGELSLDGKFLPSPVKGVLPIAIWSS